MADAKITNLDQDIAEYFEFELKGNVYRMRYPTVEEFDEMRANSGDEQKTRQLVLKIIETVSEGAPSILELYKTLPINKWTRLVKLIVDKVSE